MQTAVTKTFLFVGLPAALGLVGLVLASMEMQRFLTTSTRFAVHKVEVLSKGSADPEELTRLAGITPGANIFAIDLDEVRRRVERDPWVHDATVIRVLPNRIQVSYRSQEPKAILGSDVMYYLNAEGVAFYRVKSGDSLAYPLVQLENKGKGEFTRQRVAAAVKILNRLKASPLFFEKDLGDMTVNTEAEEGSAPYLLTLRFPPKPLAGKAAQAGQPYTVSLADDELERQVKHWEAVVRHLVQTGKKPRLIRLELGKKVVVKLDK